MPSWNQLVDTFEGLPNEKRDQWLLSGFFSQLKTIAKLRDRNVLFYGSAFLQKPLAPALVQVGLIPDGLLLGES